MTAREMILALPTRIVPAAIEGHNTCFHFIVSGTGGGEVTVAIANGECTATEGLHGEPKCTLRCTDETFEGIVTGKQNPQMAVMMGKLKISNLSEMLKYSKIFGMM